MEEVDYEITSTEVKDDDMLNLVWLIALVLVLETAIIIITKPVLSSILLSIKYHYIIFVCLFVNISYHDYLLFTL